MPTLIPLNSLLGAAEIGIIFSILILGITILQVFLYYTEHCEKEGWFMKTFVAVVLALQTFHAILISIALYHYTVTNYGDYTVLAREIWTLPLQVGLGGLSTLLVRLFYAYRIYRLGGNRMPLPLFIVVTCFAVFGISIAFTVKAFGLIYFSRLPDISTYNTAGLTLDILLDLIIAICTIYYLRQIRSGLRTTSRALKKLVAYSMNTCLLTSAVTLASVIAWRLSDQSLIGFGFSTVAIQLYGCSLMTVLNSRDGLRSDLGRSGTNVISLGGLISSSGSSSAENGSMNAVVPTEKEADGQGKLVLMDQHSSMVGGASK